MTANTFDVPAAAARCRQHRRRILEISQMVGALHIGGAFSCLEAVDTIYHGLMRRGIDGQTQDTFLLSKGHGCMSQYVVLEDLGILPREALENYCTKDGLLGVHPDLGVPGIQAATGSLGHGLSMGLGMAIAERNKAPQDPGRVYVVISDGELQEGSTWEAILMGSSLGLGNLVLVVDNNDFQSADRTSQTHPTFYPLPEKFAAFGWEVAHIDGHDQGRLAEVVWGRDATRPLAVVARTVKGKGVSFMENVAMWHYRSPNPQEYLQALADIDSGWIPKAAPAGAAP